MKVGYARVSSKSQNLARQIKILKKDNCQKIFKEKISGKNTNRPQLHKMLNFIRDNDIVEVSAIDRLGRNKNDDIRIMREIKAKGASVDLANLDMMTPPVKHKNETDNHFKQRQNTYSFISTIMIQAIAYVAETERREIKERQRQGIKIAKENGKYAGGKTKFHKDDDTTQKAIHALDNRKSNGLSSTQIARLYGMSRSELYYLKRKFNK